MQRDFPPGRVVMFHARFRRDLSQIMKSRYEVTRLGLGATGFFCDAHTKRNARFSLTTILKTSTGNAHISSLECELVNERK